MGVVNQYYVGSDNRKALVEFNKEVYGFPAVPFIGTETGKGFENYYEGKYYELLDELQKYALKKDVEFYVFCNGEMREDYYYAIINKNGIYKKDIEVIYPSLRDCEDMM